MKKYIKAIVMDAKSGANLVFNLKLSEAFLLSRMIQNEGKIILELVECSKEQYKLIFGK